MAGGSEPQGAAAGKRQGLARAGSRGVAGPSDAADENEADRTQAELREARDTATKAMRSPADFLSRMSHELRTPLNAILGFAQLLELDQLEDDQRAAVEHIVRAGQHLLSLIDAVLDMARIDATGIATWSEPVELSSVVDDVEVLLDQLAADAAVRLQVDRASLAGQCVIADPQRLAQVLLNLGSNAVKYNHRGGSVTFSARAIEPDRLRVEVTDTGVGIPPERYEELFVPFSRLGAEHSGIEGTGVGLALSKSLVESMGGTIGMLPASGGGSTFWIELQRTQDALPRGSRDGAAAPTEVGGSKVGGSKVDGSEVDGSRGGNGEALVLSVEDDPDSAELIRLILARLAGTRVLTSDDPGMTVAITRSRRPDLVLLDLDLRGGRGEEILHRVRADPALAATKVVVVSADATPSSVRTVMALGADAYLTKPIDIAALLRVVERLSGHPHHAETT
jgi:signal transduction histidine kinase/ActR/RegA family two-component response regulator